MKIGVEYFPGNLPATTTYIDGAGNETVEPTPEWAAENYRVLISVAKSALNGSAPTDLSASQSTNT